MKHRSSLAALDTALVRSSAEIRTAAVVNNEPGDFRSRLTVQGTVKINVRQIIQVQVNFEFMTKDFQRVAAFVFGVVFVAAMLALAVFIPKPTPFQYTVFRIVLALAAAGAAAMFPGFLTARVGNFVRAGGAMAVFVIVFFYSPAGIVAH